MEYNIGDIVRTKKQHPCRKQKLGNNKSWCRLQTKMLGVPACCYVAKREGFKGNNKENIV